MSAQEFRFTMDISIRITGTETKKDAVRDAVLLILQNNVTAGNIDEAIWSIRQTTVPEGGVVK